jgi:peptidoglycan/xylan/chitin deacetylase (PgdA/CDA1 family)
MGGLPVKALKLNILMYHSISDGEGPTSMPPETFRRHIEVLAECGYSSISAGTFRSWRQGQVELGQRTVWITFDDGFRDFRDNAFPVLRAHGFHSTVFLPSSRMGRTENWVGARTRQPRRLLSWADARDLQSENVDFGGHSVTHPDLTELSDPALELEVRQCREQIEDHLGETPPSFAPPYRRSGPRERDQIRRWFDISVGTRLQRATRDSDPFDLPRIEMHYFRDAGRWRDFLENRAETYFTVRRGLRAARELVTGP